MDKNFDIQSYMTRGVERIVKYSIKSTLTNPKESIFLSSFAIAAKNAAKKRVDAENNGEHVPAFLIASITSNCNLHCAGCYSRCSNATNDEVANNLLTKDDWKKIFDEANELGISFILLAGGEPLLRKDVIELSTNYKNIVFPIFTNGTFVNEHYLNLFDDNRNLVPIVSIEGDREATDTRRGTGVYDKVSSNMDEFKKRNLFYGVSITVTKKNLEEVSSSEFINKLYSKGLKVVIYVEYVPVDEKSANLAIEDFDRNRMNKNIISLRERFDDMIFISFPGDEKSSHGCIAAGRGFFHINATGNAEPCPFSPFSDVNIKNMSIKEALKSKLFKLLNEQNLLNDDHKGGCVLFEKRAEVERLLQMD